MCPVWGLGEIPAPLGPWLPHLSMMSLGSESVKVYCIHLAGPWALGGCVCK